MAFKGKTNITTWLWNHSITDSSAHFLERKCKENFKLDEKNLPEISLRDKTYGRQEMICLD